MKTIRIFMLCFLAVLGTGALSGCATTSHDSVYVYDPSVHEDIKRTQKKPDATEDMNWPEKAGYYLGWVSLNVIYAMAASNPSFQP